MENSFYIPINSGSLAHYFSRAIILPAKYFSNKPEDIQNTHSETILLSVSKWVKNSDCTLEVILTDLEIIELIPASETENFFYCKTPIPISRVKSVCFLDAKQKETTIWNINNGAAFIPESIVSVEKSNRIVPISESEIQKGKELNLTSEIIDKIKRFDIILGGFAFMRLGGKSFMNYSPNYFSTLSYFNKLIEEQTKNAAKETGLNFSDKYLALFSNKIENEWSSWREYVSKSITTEEIITIAKTKNLKAEKSYLGVLKLDSISPDTHLYDFAILATYGEGKSKSTDNLVTDIGNGTINSEKAEDVSILFGMNNGYSKLRNKYKGAVKDWNVKFTLDSKLDYYIIESVFQFAFHGSKASYSFDYIDKWCPSSKKATSVKGYETYNILDTTVIAKKKQSPLEIFLESSSADIYIAIFKSISQWLPPFTKSDEKLAIDYFEKQLKHVLSESVEALQKRIENEFEDSYNAQKQEAIETHKAEVEKLRTELSLLKQENQNLKSQNKTQLVSEQSYAEGQTGADLKKNETYENKEVVNVVSERDIEKSVNFESMSLKELKKIAKEKKIKGYTKIINEEELINLIKKAPPTLL